MWLWPMYTHIRSHVDTKLWQEIVVETRTWFGRIRDLPLHGEELSVEFSQDGEAVRSTVKAEETDMGQYAVTYKVSACIVMA